MSSQELSVLPSYNTTVHHSPQYCNNSSGLSSPQGSSPNTPPDTMPHDPSETPHQMMNDQQSIQSGSSPAGYPTLASRMSLIPEIAVFRRFGALNAQNLLYLQAELQDMEQSLRDLQVRDSKSTGEASWHSTNWWYLAHAAERGTNPEQWELVQKIRKKLDEYSKFHVRTKFWCNYLFTKYSRSGYHPTIPYSSHATTWKEGPDLPPEILGNRRYGPISTHWR